MGFFYFAAKHKDLNSICVREYLSTDVKVFCNVTNKIILGYSAMFCFIQNSDLISFAFYLRFLLSAYFNPYNMGACNIFWSKCWRKISQFFTKTNCWIWPSLRPLTHQAINRLMPQWSVPANYLAQPSRGGCAGAHPWSWIRGCKLPPQIPSLIVTYCPT